MEYKPNKGERKDADETLDDVDKTDDADVLGKDMDERRSPQEICGDLLTGLAFLFKDLEAKPENVFQSPLLLQLLAHISKPRVNCPVLASTGQCYSAHSEGPHVEYLHRTIIVSIVCPSL